ncbi:MAG TPA: hypothetical protein VK395_08065 [Gemmataceae bacterium]|nr:hypothetical protein [Gemmataceae bacterium]
MLMVAADVRRQQPHHVIAQLAIALGPRGQVKVVREHAVSEQAHRRALGRLREKLQKSGVVAILVEDHAATIIAIEHVVAITTLGSARSASHGEHYHPRRSLGQAKVRCPLFLRLVYKGSTNFAAAHTDFACLGTFVGKCATVIVLYAHP